MRYLLVVLWMLFWSVPSAMAQVSIAINLSLFPELVQVPNYPVYYAPRMNSNYFFYDGMYWVYQGDNWYSSSWYNGPWGSIGPEAVPLYVLRIPVRYYRDPPGYFRGWRSDAPPRWGEHWGNQWEQRRSGWDKWNRASAPRPAPLPVYQRQYSGDRYPRAEQQQALHSQNYRYRPRDPVVRQHYQEQTVKKGPAPSSRGQQAGREEKSPRQQDTQRSSPPAPVQQSAPAATRAQPPQRDGENARRSAPTQKGGENAQRPAPAQAPPQQRGPAVQDQRQQPKQGAVQREQQTPRSSQGTSAQGKGSSPEAKRRQGQEKDRDKGEERGQERNK